MWLSVAPKGGSHWDQALNYPHPPAALLQQVPCDKKSAPEVRRKHGLGFRVVNVHVQEAKTFENRNRRDWSMSLLAIESVVKTLNSPELTWNPNVGPSQATVLLKRGP